MNKSVIVAVISIIAVVLFWASPKMVSKQETKDKVSFSKIEGSSYWTCPMHPQIHLDHEGECPICHMKLVKVAQTSQIQNIKSEAGDNRSSIIATPGQLELIGIQKVKVEKMDLFLKIPISGRAISSTTIAFQIYEKDIRLIHAGLKFRGESTLTYDDAGILGVIAAVDSIVDPSSRTVRAIGTIQKGPKNLLPETSFSGEIQIELKDRLAIPESAVLYTGNQNLVYLFAEEGKLVPKAVKLGIKTEGFYEVIEGLFRGDVISSGPNFLIDSEAKIRGAND